ncbi:Spo0E like sporulation regulatory protein [Salimicrobium halophilum]|uniref:Spo0E like sporulation regulatory protein n=1 Tax=Salimicrobium halophilum TaxID=86666 RepID=A0A1G8QZY9_9BACI|nr:Spo0E like sporulation regulatory protein [Salimicrobium halophilum]
MECKEKRTLLKEIEKVRKKMFQAYERNESYDHLVKISQRLDTLLNKFEYQYKCK